MHVVFFACFLGAVALAVHFAGTFLGALLDPYLPVGWQDRVLTAIYFMFGIYVFFNVYGRIERLEEEVRTLKARMRE